ncbi:hypothetical protein ACTXT7_009352 [Hymenolepis weldensis]
MGRHRQIDYSKLKDGLPADSLLWPNSSERMKSAAANCLRMFLYASSTKSLHLSRNDQQELPVPNFRLL